MRTLSSSAQTPKVKHSSELILFGVDFTNLLVAGELLTGTPTVAIASYTSPPGSTPAAGNTTPALTLAAPLVNAAPFENDSEFTVAIGCGVQVRISGGLSPTDYLVTVICGTSGGNTRTIVCNLQLRDS